MHQCHRLALAVLSLAMIGAWPDITRAQDAGARRSLYDAQGLVVYAAYQKVPWARVDSLIQLSRHFAAHTEKGREMGCWVDREFLIHQTGGVYNIIFKTYRTELRIPAQNPGCGTRAWEAAVPDADERAQIDAGSAWVYEGTGFEHYDEIYWEPYPSR